MSDAHIRANEVQKTTDPVRQPEPELIRRQEQGPAHAVAPQDAYRRAQLNRNGLRPADLLALQRAVGNRGVQRMVAQRQQLRGIIGGAVQLQGGLEDEEPLQSPLATAQRQTAEEEEEPLQGRFETAQRQGAEDEELQMKAAPTAPAQLEAKSPPSPNRTGLPDGLKTGIESLSGMAMDHVQVHYNSAQPAQLNALAYAQGSDIHLAPGQEQHLPHEAWHVVQQAQGRVKPTMQMQDGVPVNDDAGLEHEADVMGAQADAASGSGRGQTPAPSLTWEVVKNSSASPSVQRVVHTGLPPGTPVKHINGNGSVVSETQDGYKVRLDHAQVIDAKLGDLEYHAINRGKVANRDYAHTEELEKRLVSGPGAEASGANMEALLGPQSPGGAEALHKVLSASIVADASVYQAGVDAVSRLCDMLKHPAWRQILIHTGVYFYKEDARIRLYKTAAKPEEPKGEAVGKPEPAGSWEGGRKVVNIGKVDSQSQEQLAKTLLHEFTHLVIDSAYGNQGLPYEKNNGDREESIKYPGIVFEEWKTAQSKLDEMRGFLEHETNGKESAESAVAEIKATLYNLEQYTLKDVRDFALEVFSHYSEVCHVLARRIRPPKVEEFTELFFKNTATQFAGVVKTSEQSKDYGKILPKGAEAALEELGRAIEDAKLKEVKEIIGSDAPENFDEALRKFAKQVHTAFAFNKVDTAMGYLKTHVGNFATDVKNLETTKLALQTLYPTAVAHYGAQLGAKL